VWYRLLTRLVFFIVPLLTSGLEGRDVINLDHLRFLTESVTIDGREMALVHIYSEYPDYEWVDAAGEGISAVDDVARAAIVYLWQYERTGDSQLLALARRCLEFVRYMQADDGEFYNFVRNAEGEINETGNTSYKSLTWWAMRALWALGEGVRVFDAVDADYADTLAQSYLLTETAIRDSLRNYGEMTDLHGFEIPAWIPGGEPRYASIALLGMSAYYQARPNEATADIIMKIADGIAAYRLGDHDTYPFGMHPVLSSAPGYWHDWGAHMIHGLTVAGITLNRPDWVESAAADADSFILRHLVFERFREIGVVPNRLNQIAYGTNMIVQGYMALYRATGGERYARYAGLAASWLFGNNMAGVQMYDPQTGRVYDGIDGPVPWRVNRNAGAESTIEGLMALLAVVDEPLAADYLDVEPVSGTSWRILQAEDGERVNGEPTYYSVSWTGESFVSAGRYVALGQGDVMELTFEIENEDDYLFYIAHMRQPEQPTAETAHALYMQSPPTIDANLREWTTIPTLVSNSRAQFLRGAGLWQGPDVDSHAVQLGWDTNNFYLAVRVRDPEHAQPDTLSNVWHNDAFWVYLTDSPDARALSAKFTLAQTPDGPQVWDWVHTRFLEGASMMWQPEEGGYIYEASVPWSSLGVENPQAGTTIGFEAGRGVGGNSFMNLTGRDPDVAPNLLPVTLVDADLLAEANNAPPAPVFLRVQLDGEDPALLAESTSPDRSHFWLDRVWREPLHLTPGAYNLRYQYAGASEEATSKVDAFYLQPAVARRTFQHPDGRLITLTYDTLTGESSWDETR
jgi:hypothetical protein